jgi:Tfp pilus assembly protein PilV
LKTSNERGFTVIEALFAIVILTISLVSLAELMAITLRMQMLGRNQTATTFTAAAGPSLQGPRIPPWRPRLPPAPWLPIRSGF